MAFLGNGTIPAVFGLATTNITGGEFLTVLGLLLIFIFLALAAKLNFEVIVMVLMPMVIYFLAYNSEMILAGGILIVYLGFLAASYFFNR